MSAESNKEIVRRFAQVWNGGSVDIVDELAAPELVVSYPLLPEELHGPAAFKQFLTLFNAAFPDVQCLVDDVIAEGDQVAARWRMRGTQRGDMPGIPATGQTAEWSGITIYRVVDGRVVEERGEENALSFLQQLGVIPRPEQAAHSNA